MISCSLPTVIDWDSAQSDLQLAQEQLRAAADPISRQLAYLALLEAERRFTELMHSWLAHAVELDPVGSPTQVLSLDVDGILEDEREGYSSAGLVGVAALKLLQLGRVAVLLNTARSLCEVKARVRQFRLLGGVACFGAATWDAVFNRKRTLVQDEAAVELERLRDSVQTRDALVVDTSKGNSVRVSRIEDGLPRSVVEADARSLLDDLSMSRLSYWVAPRHTYFVDRRVDKAAGINSLMQDLGLSELPLAAMGDSACDVPMLRLAKFVCVPVRTLPSYAAPVRQRLVRSRHSGNQALWEAACRLVPNQSLQKQVMSVVSNLEIPEWFPEGLSERPMNSSRLWPRLAAMLIPSPRCN